MTTNPADFFLGNCPTLSFCRSMSPLIRLLSCPWGDDDPTDISSVDNRTDALERSSKTRVQALIEAYAGERKRAQERKSQRRQKRRSASGDFKAAAGSSSNTDDEQLYH